MEYPEDTLGFLYVVLDEQGFLLNSILVASPYPENYWPGYGRYIAYAGKDPAPAMPDNMEITSNFTYLPIRPVEPMEWGAKMDIQTGAITPPPSQPPVEEVFAVEPEL